MSEFAGGVLAGTVALLVLIFCAASAAEHEANKIAAECVAHGQVNVRDRLYECKLK